LGAREVVQPEFEASLELATHLTGMGLSLPVIQQEVQQIRNHHYLELRPTRTASQVSVTFSQQPKISVAGIAYQRFS